MELRIETISEKKFAGISARMSLAEDKTYMLWSKLMPQKKNIQNAVDDNLYSLQVYDQTMAPEDFSPNTSFVKWALVETSGEGDLPDGLEKFTLKGGLYAVFIHKGLPSDFPKTMQFIFGEWMPQSEYQPDHRPHFEVLGSKYKNNHPDSEEEVWIPIKPK
ncbi:MAG: GyrI-like domain-containing protein [Cyclobacteriaceae bacterium]